MNPFWKNLGDFDCNLSFFSFDFWRWTRGSFFMPVEPELGYLNKVTFQNPSPPDWKQNE